MNNKLLMGAAAGALALAALWYAKSKVPAALDALTEGAAAFGAAVNPLNKENVFYTGTNAIGATVTGDDSWNLGARLWEVLNPAQVAAERAVLGDSPFIQGGARAVEADPISYEDPWRSTW